MLWTSLNLMWIGVVPNLKEVLKIMKSINSYQLLQSSCSKNTTMSMMFYCAYGKTVASWCSHDKVLFIIIASPNYSTTSKHFNKFFVFMSDEKSGTRLSILLA